jgi:hydroxypyruvate reductase
VLALARTARPGDCVLFLISGGASAVLSLPADGITMADKQAINAALLRSGVPIAAMNGVRKHLSAIKGGRLAVAAAGARQVTLLISDVPGDDPAVIGSGPTVGDPTTLAQARATLARYDIAASSAVAAWLADPANETPKPGDPRFAGSEVHLVATPMLVLEAAAAVARRHGVVPLILGDAIEGEACEVACIMAGQARRFAHEGKPMVLLSGGETTVTLRGEGQPSGRGGRNTEFLLAMAIALAGAPGIHALAGDTDGIDGSESNAGALIRPDSLARAEQRGTDARSLLAAHDAYAFFAELGDLVVTGPTHTNVNDFRAVLILP